MWLSFHLMAIHSIIVPVGGAFIIYTALKEIWHMISLQGDSHKLEDKEKVLNLPMLQ